LPKRLWQNAPQSYPTLDERVDWSRTKAYSFGYIGQIYVNLRGREPEGIVEPGEERRQLVAEIKRQLYELRDPDTGEKVVDAAYASEELYAGPYLDRAPDINVVMRDLSYITHIGRELASTRTFGPVSTQESATHRLEGLVILNGAGVRQGGVLVGTSITDLAPTILHLTGLPVPDDMDGRVLTDAFTDPFRVAYPVVQCEADPAPEGRAYAWSEEDEEALQDRLKSLGYMA
jgi:predicted AlkP superfamily phosphohydrolase/phosphomutase